MTKSLRATALLMFAASTVVAAGPRRLTVETVQSKAFRDALSVPETTWLADGSVLLLDARRPEEDRTLERLDPDSGQRTPAVDAKAALATLAPLGVTGDAAPSSLEWPEALDRDGRRAVYVFDDDLFLLDLAASSFSRLTRTPEVEKDPRFSPGGTAVAFVRGTDLWMRDLAAGTERALTGDGSDTVLNATLSWVYWEEIFGREDTAYWWSPDGTAIAFLQTDESMVDVSVFPGFEPATPEVLHQRYPKAGSANPVVRLGIVDVKDGSLTWARLGEPAPEYLVRVQWLPGSRTVALQTLDRAQQRLELRLVDRADGAARTVLTETSTTSINIHDDLVFLGGGGRFLWTSERDGHNHIYLYAVDGTLIRRLTSGDIMVRASSGLAWIRGGIVGVDDADGTVYFTASTGSPVAPALYRVALGGGAVERVSREDGTHRVGFAPSMRRYLDAYSNASTPTGLYLCAADGRRLRTVTEPATAFLAPYDLQTPVQFTVPARDGFRLPLQVTKPRDFDPSRRYPIIVYVYGGPSAPVVWNAWGRYTPWDNILLDNGFITASIDPRVASAVSKTVEDTSYRRLMSGYEVSDMEDAVAWLTSQPWVDAARIGVWGWSGGGTYTLQLMTHTTLFAAGIAVAPVTDYRYYDTVWTERMMGTPEDNPEGYAAGAPAAAAADLHGRLLLIHGTGDDNVHPQNTFRFIDELVRSGVQFDLAMYPLEKHGIRGARAHVFETMLRFWRTDLAPAAGAHE